MSIQNDKSSDEQQLSAKTCNNTNGNSSNNNNNNNKIQEDDDESVHNEFGKRVLRESSAPNSIAQPAEDNVDMAATGEYSNGAGPGAKRLARNTNLNKRPRISPKSKNPNATSKLPPAPVYKPDENPTQTLNKLHPGLAFVYEIDAASLNTSTPMPPNRFICRVQIALANKIDAATASLAVESAPLAGAPRNTPTIAATTIVTAPSIVDTSNMPMMAFSGTGPSKRDAKRMCAQAVLCGLYGETYKPPRPPTPPPTAAAAAAADTKTPLTTTTSSTKEPALVDPSDAFRKRAQPIQARITKLLNNCSSRPKNASQLLNEMSAQISATAKCISQIPGPLNAPSSVVFTYNVSNINGESLVEPTGEEDSTTRVALGTGKHTSINIIISIHFKGELYLFLILISPTTHRPIDQPTNCRQEQERSENARLQACHQAVFPFRFGRAANGGQRACGWRRRFVHENRWLAVMMIIYMCVVYAMRSAFSETLTS